MSKSFPITNEMRAKVADELTVKAVSKHGPRLAKALQKLNALYWGQHLAAVDALLQIDRARWPELIAAGVIQATASVIPRIAQKGNLASFTSRRSDSRDAVIRRLVLNSPAYSTVSQFVKKESRYSSESDAFWFISEIGSIPRLNDMDVVNADSTIAKQAAKLYEELRAVFEAADKFRSDVESILMSCRTSRQLFDLFPEAAVLLPQPVKTGSELAPVELVDSVRGMLSKGVPPTSKAA